MTTIALPDARSALLRDALRDVFAHGELTYAETPPRLFVLALLYLLLPTLIVLARFLSWEAAMAVLAAGAGAVVWLVRYWRTAPGWTSWDTWPFLLVAAMGAWMTGVLPPFAQNNDWLKHYAVFNALVEQAWPPVIPTELGFGTLRYSLSYYVVPSLIAKFAGAPLLGAAIFMWTTLGLYLALALAFGGRAMPVTARLFLGCVFLFFSGADVAGDGLTHAPLLAPMHYEWWARIGQFSSTITSILWTPQHAISAWIATFLILRYPARAVQAGGVLGAAVAVWSPFSAIGIVPVMLWAVWRAGPRHLLTWMNLIVAPVLLVAAALFLTKGAVGIPASFVWTRPSFSWRVWLGFVVLEFGAIAASLMLVAPRNAALIVMSTLSLLLLSLSNVGVYSDLMMRGSLPALAIFAALAAVAVVAAPNTLRKLPLIVCLALGVVTPAGEIMRGLTTDRFADPSQYRLSDIVGGIDTGLAPQYIVPNYAGRVVRTPVATIDTVHLVHHGKADFDDARHRIAATAPTDAAWVTPRLALPAGQYEIEAVVDWDVAAEPGAWPAANIALQGQRVLRQFGTSRAHDQKLLLYFVTSGEPVAVSLGFGGAKKEKGTGYMEFKQLKISRITY